MGLDTFIGIAVVLAIAVFVFIFWAYSSIAKMEKAETGKPLPPPQVQPPDDRK